MSHKLWVPALVAALGCFGTVRAEPTDAVEGLRQVLGEPVPDPVLRERKARMWLAGLHSLAQQSQALRLREWRDEDVDETIAKIDRANRVALLQQFEQSVRAVFDKSDPLSQVAALDLLGSMGSATLAPRVGRLFGKDLVRLIARGDPRAREAAARALAQLHPDPQMAVPALNVLLTSGELSQRLAGGWALIALVDHGAERCLRAAGREAARQELINLVSAAVPVAGRGLTSSHVEVRRLSAALLGRALVALNKQLLEPHSADDIEQFRRQDEGLLPLFRDLKEEGPALASALEDEDNEVHILALQTLEELANLRVRWLRRNAKPDTDSVAIENEAATEEDADPLLDALRPALKPLSAEVTSTDRLVRRRALDALEMLGPAAVDAAPALVEALDVSDRFTRWAAARTLGKLGPEAADDAVPALARRLSDEDIDVQLAALAALKQFGPKAAEAAEALVESLTNSDTSEVRVAALQVLAELAADNAELVVPALRTALTDVEARIRLGAARELGRLGPAALDGVEPLRRALADPNPNVRHAAGAALLRILDQAEE